MLPPASEQSKRGPAAAATTHTKYKNYDFIARLYIRPTSFVFVRYQWYRNGRPLEGETMSTLEIRLYSPPTHETRPFRCIHCKHAA